MIHYLPIALKTSLLSSVFNLRNDKETTINRGIFKVDFEKRYFLLS
jgi:hypothetical protein